VWLYTDKTYFLFFRYTTIRLLTLR